MALATQPPAIRIDIAAEYPTFVTNQYGSPGPFPKPDFSAWYFIGAELNDMLQLFVAVYKTVNNGGSWTKVAVGPEILNQLIGGASTHYPGTGNLIYTAYADPSDNLLLVSFDMSTETFSAANDLSVTASAWVTIDVNLDENGDPIVAWDDNTGPTSHYQTLYKRYSSGSWSSTIVACPVAADHYHLEQILKSGTYAQILFSKYTAGPPSPRIDVSLAKIVGGAVSSTYVLSTSPTHWWLNRATSGPAVYDAVNDQVGIPVVTHRTSGTLPDEVHMVVVSDPEGSPSDADITVFVAPALFDIAELYPPVAAQITNGFYVNWSHRSPPPYTVGETIRYSTCATLDGTWSAAEIYFDLLQSGLPPNTTGPKIRGNFVWSIYGIPQVTIGLTAGTLWTDNNYYDEQFIPHFLYDGVSCVDFVHTLPLRFRWVDNANNPNFSDGNACANVQSLICRVGTEIFALITFASGLPGLVQSSDAGWTWTLKDFANTPAYAAKPWGLFSAGGKVWAIGVDSSRLVIITPFNPATGLWETPDATGFEAVQPTNTPHMGLTYGAVRSNGSVVLAHSSFNVDSTMGSGESFKIRQRIGASWSLIGEVPSGAVSESTYLAGGCMTPAGIVHLFFFQRGFDVFDDNTAIGLYHVSVSASGVVSAPHLLEADIEDIGKIPDAMVCQARISVTGKIAFSYTHMAQTNFFLSPKKFGAIHVAIGDPTADPLAPTWTIETAVATETNAPAPGADGQRCIGCAWVAGTLEVYWKSYYPSANANAVSPFADTNKIWRIVRDAGGTWGSIEMMVDPADYTSLKRKNWEFDLLDGFSTGPGVLINISYSRAFPGTGYNGRCMTDLEGGGEEEPSRFGNYVSDKGGLVNAGNYVTKQRNQYEKDAIELDRVPAGRVPAIGPYLPSPAHSHSNRRPPACGCS